MIQNAIAIFTKRLFQIYNEYCSQLGLNREILFFNCIEKVHFLIKRRVAPSDFPLTETTWSFKPLIQTTARN